MAAEEEEDTQNSKALVWAAIAVLGLAAIVAFKFILSAPPGTGFGKATKGERLLDLAVAAAGAWITWALWWSHRRLPRKEEEKGSEMTPEESAPVIVPRESGSLKIFYWVSICLLVLFVVFAYVNYPNWLHRPPPLLPGEGEHPNWGPGGVDDFGEFVAIPVGAVVLVALWIVDLVQKRRYRAEKERERTLGSSSPPIDPT